MYSELFFLLKKTYEEYCIQFEIIDMKIIFFEWF